MKFRITIILITILSLSVVNVNCQQNNLNFDGIDDYVVLDALATPLSATSNFTVEFWIAADFNLNTSSVRTNLFAINPAAPGDNKFSIVMGSFSPSVQNGNICIYEAGGSTIYIQSSSSVGDSKCHHIAYVRSGSMGEAFIDGVSMGTIPTGTAIASNDRISLGQEWDNAASSDFFNGNIDELRIWNVARTQSEIQSNMSTTFTGSEPGLIAYYNFDQGITAGNNTGITTLNDLSPNNLDGTLTNFGLTGVTSNWIFGNCLSLSSVKEENSSMLALYPNPVTSFVTLKFKTFLDNAVITISNSMGQTVKQINQVTGEQLVVDIQTLSTGTYIVSVSEKSEMVAQQKMVIYMP
jgi:hypothetical protein